MASRHRFERLEDRQLLTKFCGVVSEFSRTTEDDIPNGLEIGDVVAGDFDEDSFGFATKDVDWTMPSPELEVSAFPPFGTNTNVFGNTTDPADGRANLNYTTGFPPVMWWEPQPYARDANERTIDFDVSIVPPATKCIDLTVASIDLDTTHSARVTPGGGAETIESVIEVRNDGPDPTGVYDVVVYASAVDSPYTGSQQTFLLGTEALPSLERGESRSLTLEFPDPIYLLGADFSEGYVIGAHARPLELEVRDFYPENNFLTVSGCDSEHLEEDRSFLEGLVLTGGLIGSVASTHMANYLAGTGAEVNWLPGSDVSRQVAELALFTEARDNVIAYATDIIMESVASVIASGESLPSTLPSVQVPESVIGRPAFGPVSAGLDLFLGIHGTQGSSGIVSGITMSYEELGGDVVVANLSGDLGVTFVDEYAFEPDDALKGFFNDEARHVAMCGMAKPFEVNLSVVVPIAASFVLGGPIGDIDGDGETGFKDFLIMAENYGKSDAEFGEGDVDGDGEIGFSDFLLLADHFGSKSMQLIL